MSPVPATLFSAADWILQFSGSPFFAIILISHVIAFGAIIWIFYVISIIWIFHVIAYGAIIWNFHVISIIWIFHVIAFGAIIWIFM